MQLFIFSIKKEISEQYYYKVEVMKRFLLELLSNPTSHTYRKQISFITDFFPFDDWLEEHSSIKKIVKSSLSFQVPMFDSSAPYGIIDNKNYCCFFQCESLWQAETEVLEPLRRSSQSFFILETNGKHYGWISPLAGQRLLS